jgi:hypothetical protein
MFLKRSRPGARDTVWPTTAEGTPMAKQVLAKLAALLLAVALLITTALPAFAGGKDNVKCVTVKHKATGTTTITCGEGGWE